MDIILKENVEKLGFKNEIVSVKNGYARNFLIPKGLAILATESAVKVLNENLKQQLNPLDWAENPPTHLYPELLVCASALEIEF